MTNESKVAVFQACELLPTENVVTHADYKALEDECERLRARVGELVEALSGLVANYDEDHGSEACDCRPEPENIGHVCNICIARSLVSDGGNIGVSA